MDQSGASWTRTYPGDAANVMQFTLMVKHIDVEPMEVHNMHVPDGTPWHFGRIIVSKEVGVTPIMFSVDGAWYNDRLYLKSRQSADNPSGRYLFGGASSSSVVINLRDSNIRWKYL